MKNKSKIFVELAARAPVESPVESFNAELQLDTHKWRFDLCHVVGDFIIVEVPMAFSNEGTARLALFTELMATYK